MSEEEFETWEDVAKWQEMRDEEILDILTWQTVAKSLFINLAERYEDGEISLEVVKLARDNVNKAYSEKFNTNKNLIVLQFEEGDKE